MEQKSKIWSLAQDVTRALGAHYGPAMEETAAAAGLERPAWFLLLPALLFEPDPISAEKLGVRVPYNAAKMYRERLNILARLGMLRPINENEFCLTDAGRDILQKIVDAAYAAMAALKPMPEADLARLVGLLQRLVAASEAAPEPPGKWGIHHSRRLKIAEDAAYTIYIDQYLSDLSAYRDDAHLAAWQSSGLSAEAWEAFTLLWQGEVGTLDDLCQKLEYRGHGRSVYRAALAELVDHGWLEQHQGKYCLTPAGQAERHAAEQMTDHFFYLPWSALTGVELETLENLISRLLAGLGQP